MEFDLPKDLLFQIFMTLPPKSLLCCRCVSKYWYSVITSFDFIDLHLHYNHYQNQFCCNSNVLFKKTLSDPKEEIYSLHADNHQFDEIGSFNFPFENFSIVGCDNGLVCLMKPYSRSLNILMLWNPVMRKYFILPELVDQSVNGGCGVSSVELLLSPVLEMYFGFGYDVLSKDFKVVSLLVYAHHTSVVVFSLSTKCWKTLASFVLLRPYSRSCNVGGFVYRLALINFTDHDFCSIKVLSFDLSAEVFMEIALPIVDPEVKFELANYRGSLGLVQERYCNIFDIWVMREDGVGVAKSWMRLFSVHLDGGDFLGQRIVGFTKNGVVLVVGDGNVLVSPIEEDAQVVNYVAPRFRFRFRSQEAWHVESFKESLALLDEGLIYH